MRAGHAGIRRAHDHADRDEQERQRDGRRGEPLEAGHESSALPPRAADECAAILARRPEAARRAAPASRPTARSRLHRYPIGHASPISIAGDRRRPAREPRDRHRLRARCRPVARPRPAAPNGSPGASGDAEIFPIIISDRADRRREPDHVHVPGDERPAGRAPDRTASVALHRPAAARRSPRSDPGRSSGRSRTRRRLRRRTSTFPVAGAWTAEFTTAAPDSPEQTIPFSFDVQTDASVVWPGEDARRSKRRRSPTSAATSRRSRPTPTPTRRSTRPRSPTRSRRRSRSCSSSPRRSSARPRCGPTLDEVKPVAADHPTSRSSTSSRTSSRTSTGQLQPDLDADGKLQAAPATTAFGLLIEPFVFVVDGDGVVTASFELIFTTDELTPRSTRVELGAGDATASSRRYDDALAVLVAIDHAAPGRPSRCARRGGRAGTRCRSRAAPSRKSTVRPSASGA